MHTGGQEMSKFLRPAYKCAKQIAMAVNEAITE